MSAPRSAPRLAPALKTGLTWPARLGTVACVALPVLMAMVMEATLINGAVVAPGQALVRGKPKTVQSLDGGVVERIAVANGDKVAAGELLVKLDPSLLRIDRDLDRQRLAEAFARQQRLQAEYDGRDSVSFDTAPDPISPTALAAHKEEQRTIFRTRKEVRDGRAKQLRERIRQLEERRNGVEARLAAKREQMDFVQRELGTTRTLREKGLAPQRDVLKLQRRQSELSGLIAEHRSELASTASSIRDARMQILQAEREFREKAVTELRKATSTVEELTLEIAKTEKQLQRIDIRAPVAGVVHEMRVSTEGGVIAPSKSIMQIIPLSEGVEFELRIPPKSIDDVFVGQTARVKLPSLEGAGTPRMTGRVAEISPSSVTDADAGTSFYRAELRIPPDELARLDDVTVVPGMPVETFLQTGAHSILDYLIGPLADQLTHAFRE